MENNLVSIDNIENLIYEIRGVQVMLDSDLARLFQCKNGTKEINQAVKNNPSKFPERFSWILSEYDISYLRSNFLTANISSKSRTKPRVFTEQGIYMLATIIKSDVAVNTSIAIMDVFVKMRHYINYNKLLLPNKILLLEDKVDNNTKRIDELFDKFSPKDIIKNKIFFEGEFYDAYSFLLDILNTSKKEIIIIDNYAGKELLDLLKDVNKKIIIVSKNINEDTKLKYLEQYNNISFIDNKTFHDRFIIIDKKKLYMCGSSFKDLGKKCFYMGEIDNKDDLKNILNNINK